MIRGTTQAFKFQVPYDFTWEKAYVNVTFWQKGYNGPDKSRKLPIIKTRANCSWSAQTKEISVTLNPEETARFSADRKAYAQLSVTTESNLRFASREQEITVYPIYNDSQLGDMITPEDDGTIVLDGGEIKESSEGDDFTIFDGEDI